MHGGTERNAKGIQMSHLLGSIKGIVDCNGVVALLPAIGFNGAPTLTLARESIISTLYACRRRNSA
jgi:hypothetical protein